MKNPYSKLTIEKLKALAEQGDAEAQFLLGERYKKEMVLKKTSLKP